MRKGTHGNEQQEGLVLQHVASLCAKPFGWCVERGLPDESHQLERPTPTATAQGLQERWEHPGSSVDASNFPSTTACVFPVMCCLPGLGRHLAPVPTLRHTPVASRYQVLVTG